MSKDALENILGSTVMYIQYDFNVPDWVKKELSVEFELILDNLHRLDTEQHSQMIKSLRGTVCLTGTPDYWDSYVQFIISLRHYSTDPIHRNWEKVTACRGLTMHYIRKVTEP